MKHILPIKSTYISRWGIWECLRELVQNAKDEEEQHGSKMRVYYKRGWLHIENEGADLSVKALLIGQSGKAGRSDLRGEHGEGLDLAFLAGVRDGYDIEVTTKTEKWTPALEQRQEFDYERCLVVNTRKLKKPGDGVRVSVCIGQEKWDSLKGRFLFIDPPKAMVETDSGALIMDEERRGQIFVKGIYVMHAHKTFGYGFDLKDVRLDRDRQTIAGFDLQWEMSKVVTHALAKDPVRFAGPVLELFDKNSEEVEHIDSQMYKGSPASVGLAEAFRAKHGPDAVPVRSIADGQAIEHFGLKSVLVSDAAARALSKEMGDVAATKERLKMQATARYSWSDLSEAEQTNLVRAQEAISAIAVGKLGQDVLASLQVVDFHGPEVLGSCNLRTGEMEVARSRCDNYFDLMEVLVHELAHAISEAGDGTRSHVSTIEGLWRALYERACKVPE